MARADPRTTQRYNRARHQLDSHATYAVAGLLNDKPESGEYGRYTEPHN